VSPARPVSAVTVSPARPVAPDPKLAPVTPTKAATPTSAKPASASFDQLQRMWESDRKSACTRPTRHPDCKSDKVGCGHVFCEHCYPPGPGPCS
jgi:hypothetical protein